MSDKSLEPPKPSKGDLAHAGARAVLGAIPILGSPFTELFHAIINPPLVRRLQEWTEAVAEKLTELEQSGSLRIEELSENDEFIDAVLHATQAALRTSREEKREALRNTVLNVAVGNAPKQSLQQMFLSWIDSFTVWHLRILALFDDPSKRTPPKGEMTQSDRSSLSKVLTSIYPELSDRGFYDQVWADLRTRGLVTIDGLHTTMTTRAAMARRTTELGQSFLRFIAAPR